MFYVIRVFDRFLKPMMSPVLTQKHMFANVLFWGTFQSMWTSHSIVGNVICLFASYQILWTHIGKVSGLLLLVACFSIKVAYSLFQRRPLTKRAELCFTLLKTVENEQPILTLPKRKLSNNNSIHDDSSKRKRRYGHFNWGFQLGRKRVDNEKG